MAWEARAWLRRFWPQPHAAGAAERARALGGALLGLLATAGLSHLIVGGHTPTLLAPMGASAILLFCLPASPLAQPWPLVAGNVLSAAVGVGCAHLLGPGMLAAPLAACLAIAVMFRLRCLHPPGGAVAMMAVLGAGVVPAGDPRLVLLVGLDSLLLALAALAYNNLSGRRYPHPQQSALSGAHATRDPVASARVGFAKEDLDAALARYGQVLDVSRDDLEAILLDTALQAWQRRTGVVTVGQIMARDLVSVAPATPLAAAWTALHRHRLHALPVLQDGTLVGIVTASDFLHGIAAFGGASGWRRLAGLVFGGRGAAARTVGQIMTAQVVTVTSRAPVAALLPLMVNSGLHHLPVVDEGRCVGMVSQSDLLAALVEEGRVAA